MKTYLVDFSYDQYEWFVGHPPTTSLDEAMEWAMTRYEAGIYVKIWDEAERLVWANGRMASAFHQPSQFELEWEEYQRVFEAAL